MVLPVFFLPRVLKDDGHKQRLIVFSSLAESSPGSFFLSQCLPFVAHLKELVIDRELFDIFFLELQIKNKK